MKRPLAIIGFTYLISLVAAEKLGAGVSAIIAAFLLLCAITALLIKELRKFKAVILALMTACAAFSIFSVYAHLKIEPIKSLYDKQAVISGTVSKEPWSNYGNYYYVIETDSIELDGVPQEVTVRVSCHESIDAQVSDKVTLEVVMFRPDGNGYVTEGMNYSKGINLYAYMLYECHPIVTPQKIKTPEYYFVRLREVIRAKIKMVYSDSTSQLFLGMLLGDKTEMDDAVVNVFRRAGISHLLAVSGLHTVLIARILLWALCALNIKKRWASLFTCFGIVIFMGVAGFTPSVTRAGIMTVILMMSDIFYREADSLNSLGLACLLITVINPYAACDVGLQLSVAATLGLILLTPWLRKFFSQCYKNIKSQYIKKPLDLVFGCLSDTLAATIFTFPIIVNAFGVFSAVAPVVNILCVYPASIFLSMGIFGIVLPGQPIIRSIAAPFVFVAEKLAGYIFNVSQLFASLEFAQVPIPQICVTVWVSATLLLFVVAYCMRKSRKLYRVCAALSAIIFVFSLMSYRIINHGMLKTAVIDVDDGCAVAVVKDNRAFMINCGGNKLSYIDISNYLDNCAVSELELMLLSDLDNKASRASDEIIVDYNPSVILLPSYGERIDNFLHAVGKTKTVKLYNLTNAQCNVLDGELQVFTDEYENSWSFYKFGEFSLLVCPWKGDAQKLPEHMKKCDLLIINSEKIDNLDKISAELTVISTDTKHRLEIEMMCRSSGFEEIYSTDISGTVVVSSRADGQFTVKEEG